MPCCGRPVFTMSPARWEPISMRVSSGNCATAPRTVYLAFDADPNGSGQQAALRLAQRLRQRGIRVRTVVRCPTVTIPTASSPLAATRASSKRCWRAPRYDLSHRPTAHRQSRPLPFPHRGDHRPRSRLGEPLSRSGMPTSPGPADRSQLRACPASFPPLVGQCPPHSHGRAGCAHRFHPARLRAIPVQPTAALSPVRPSICASTWLTALCAMPSRMRPSRLLPPSRKITGATLPWASADQFPPAVAYA